MPSNRPARAAATRSRNDARGIVPAQRTSESLVTRDASRRVRRGSRGRRSAGPCSRRDPRARSRWSSRQRPTAAGRPRSRSSPRAHARRASAPARGAAPPPPSSRGRVRPRARAAAVAAPKRVLQRRAKRCRTGFASSTTSVKIDALERRLGKDARGRCCRSPERSQPLRAQRRGRARRRRVRVPDRRRTRVRGRPSASTHRAASVGARRSGHRPPPRRRTLSSPPRRKRGVLVADRPAVAHQRRSSRWPRAAMRRVRWPASSGSEPTLSWKPHAPRASPLPDQLIAGTWSSSSTGISGTAKSVTDGPRIRTQPSAARWRAPAITRSTLPTASASTMVIRSPAIPPPRVDRRRRSRSSARAPVVQPAPAVVGWSSSRPTSPRSSRPTLRSRGESSRLDDAGRVGRESRAR